METSATSIEDFIMCPRSSTNSDSELTSPVIDSEDAEVVEDSLSSGVDVSVSVEIPLPLPLATLEQKYLVILAVGFGALLRPAIFSRTWAAGTCTKSREHSACVHETDAHASVHAYNLSLAGSFEPPEPPLATGLKHNVVVLVGYERQLSYSKTPHYYIYLQAAMDMIPHKCPAVIGLVLNIKQ